MGKQIVDFRSFANALKKTNLQQVHIQKFSLERVADPNYLLRGAQFFSRS